MRYFVVANSFAAPFISDQSMTFVRGIDPDEALQRFLSGYHHPCGLYAAACYETADAYHEGREPVGRWLSPEAERQEKVDG